METLETNFWTVQFRHIHNFTAYTAINEYYHEYFHCVLLRSM